MLIYFLGYQSNQSDFISLQQFFSKGKVPYEIRLIPLDDSNQIILEKIDAKVYVDLLESMSFDNNVEIQNFINPLTTNYTFYCNYNKNLQYSGSLSQIQQEDFSFLFIDFQIIACPTSLVFLKFYANFQYNFSSSYYFNPNSLNENIKNSYYIFLPIKIKRCILGEFFNPKTTSCQICPEGYYTDFYDTLNCKICLENTDCAGGSNFEVKANYWKDQNYTENIYHYDNFVGNCLGGDEAQCLDEYFGPLCSNCFSKDNLTFYKDYLGKCTQCPNHFLVITLYLIVINIFAYVLKKIGLLFEKGNENDK